MKLVSLIEKIGFSQHLSKDVEDVTADKFEDFGITVGQLYQTFLKKDLSADPAIAQKIMDMVDTDDDNALANQIKDLAFLVNQLPNKPEKKGKIGYRESYEVNESSGVIDKIAGGIPYRYEGDGRTGQAIISEPLDDDTKTRIIKRAKQAGYSAKPNMGGGVTIIITGKERKLSEDDRSEKDKEFDLAQQLSKLTKDDKIKLKKIIQLMAKEKNEEKVYGFDFHYTHGTSGGTQQFGRPRIAAEAETGGYMGRDTDAADVASKVGGEVEGSIEALLKSFCWQGDCDDENKKDDKGYEIPVDWSDATDKEIRDVGGDVYYGDKENKNPTYQIYKRKEGTKEKPKIHTDTTYPTKEKAVEAAKELSDSEDGFKFIVKGRRRMFIPPPKGWPVVKTTWDKLSPEQKAGYVLSRKVGEKWKTLKGAKKDLSRTAVAKSKDIKKSTIASPKQNVQNNLMEQRIKETLQKRAGIIN